jgi:superfamily I DNA/RNA helicase
VALKQIILFGEQKKVLFLPPTEPIQIKGVAGSGKTTVALYRAKHLVETQSNLFQEARVAIFTFNTTLTAYIEAIKSKISGGYQKDSDQKLKRSEPGLNVLVINFHKWAFRFLKSKGVSAFINTTTFKSWQHEVLQSSVKTLLATNPESKVLSKKIEFFVEEIKWIKGKLFETEEQYLSASRIGRGTTDRVTKKDRGLIWKVFKGYNEELSKNNKIDFDDYAILTIKEIEADQTFSPPFTHIIIDEAQDLSKAQILALSKLVSEKTRSISIIADAAQRIYKSGFTWSEVGIEVRGNRTLSLKKNYRNTEAISLAATSILRYDPDPSEFTTGEPARKGGKMPVVGYFANWMQEGQYLIDEIKKLDYKNELTVVLHRDWSGMRKISYLLTSANIENEIINEYSSIDFENGRIKICTLSSVKGLEFDSVFITEVNDNVIPYPPGFNDDEEEDEVHVATERRLLYTAMTRAKDRLYLLNHGTPSRYIAEIDEDLIEKIDSSI